jgi:hypothetical protein
VGKGERLYGGIKMIKALINTHTHTHTHIYICTCVYIHSCRGGIMKPTKYYLGKGMERGGLWEYFELVQSTLYSCIELSQ